MTEIMWEDQETQGGGKDGWIEMELKSPEGSKNNITEDVAGG